MSFWQFFSAFLSSFKNVTQILLRQDEYRSRQLESFCAGRKRFFLVGTGIHSCCGGFFAWSWRLEPTFEGGSGAVPKEGAGNK